MSTLSILSKIPYVHENGYANLRCNQNPGCIMEHWKNKFVTPDIWQKIFNGTSTYKGGNHDAPPYIAAACCAQFAVSRTRVLERPLSDYEHFRQWLFDTDLTDIYSGRAFEYLWHVIFGMQAIQCVSLLHFPLIRRGRGRHERRENSVAISIRPLSMILIRFLVLFSTVVLTKRPVTASSMGDVPNFALYTRWMRC